MEQVHPNSHIITIFRSGSPLERAQGPAITEFYERSNVTIGAQFVNRNGPRIWSGLTFDEEDILLPKVLEVPKADNSFRAKVKEYYNEIDTKVPPRTGLRLEIGLKEDNTKPVSEKNFPINLDDYIRYKHANGHKKVALSQEEAQGDTNKWFYIFDPQALQETKKSARVSADAAMQLYLAVKEDISKVRMVLTLLGEDVRKYYGNDAEEKLTDELKKRATEKPDEFIKVAKNEDLEILSWIKNMVNVGILKMVGPRYIFLETNKTLGNSQEEVLYWFKEEENQDLASVLKAKCQEAMRTSPIDLTKNRQTVRKDGSPVGPTEKVAFK